MMKPSPPNKPAPKPLLERDADAHALGRAEERILLREQFAAEFREMDGDDFAGIGRAERDLLLPAPRF